MRTSVIILKTILAETYPGPCHLRAADYEKCQQLCDTSSNCAAWSFHKTTGLCEMKEPNGWLVTDDRGRVFYP